jgi:hypothetical protein
MTVPSSCFVLLPSPEPCEASSRRLISTATTPWCETRNNDFSSLLFVADIKILATAAEVYLLCPSSPLLADTEFRNMMSSWKNQLLSILLMSPSVASFTPPLLRHALRTWSSPSSTSLAYSVHDEDKPILCYLIQPTTTSTDDNASGIPQIVCTSNPEEYAWFYGIDKEQLILTHGIHDAALQCVEGASPRGVPEWECESAFQ